MMWEGLPWEATALGVNNSEDQEDSTESESDVPLATIVQAAKRHTSMSKTTAEQPNTSMNETTAEQPNTSINETTAEQPNTSMNKTTAEQPNTSMNKTMAQQPNTSMTSVWHQCDSFFCTGEVWAACHICNCLLCFTHCSQSENCLNHNVAFCSNSIDVSLFCAALPAGMHTPFLSVK